MRGEKYSVICYDSNDEFTAPVTLLGTKVDQDVYEVILPTADGEIAVFPGHEPLVGLAVPGAIAVRTNKEGTGSGLDYFCD